MSIQKLFILMFIQVIILGSTLRSTTYAITDDEYYKLVDIKESSFKYYDDILNIIFKEARSILSERESKELLKEQREWNKKRDAAIAVEKDISVKANIAAAMTRERVFDIAQKKNIVKGMNIPEEVEYEGGTCEDGTLRCSLTGKTLSVVHDTYYNCDNTSYGPGTGLESFFEMDMDTIPSNTILFEFTANEKMCKEDRQNCRNTLFLIGKRKLYLFQNANDNTSYDEFSPIGNSIAVFPKKILGSDSNERYGISIKGLQLGMHMDEVVEWVENTFKIKNPNFTTKLMGHVIEGLGTFPSMNEAEVIIVCKEEALYSYTFTIRSTKRFFNADISSKEDTMTFMQEFVNHYQIPKMDGKIKYNNIKKEYAEYIYNNTDEGYKVTVKCFYANYPFLPNGISIEVEKIQKRSDYSF